MASHGARSNIPTTANLTGVRSSASVKRGQAESKANMIIRTLHRQPALQFIIRRSFKGGKTLITLDAGGFTRKGFNNEQVLVSVDKAEYLMNRYVKDAQRAMRNAKKTGGTWKSYENALAAEKVGKQALDVLQSIRNRIKK